jgi:predicted nucleic acid-binding protein
VYILDTDVVTIVDGSRNNETVQDWYDGIDETDIHLCVVTIFERAKNASRLSRNGRTQDAQKAETTLAKLKTVFGKRILHLEVSAADDWGRMQGQKEGHLMDCAIAAIARHHKFMVATRNGQDYVGRGAIWINPFVRPAKVNRPED